MEMELDDIAQVTGQLDGADAYAVARAARKNTEYRKKIQGLINKWNDAAAGKNGRDMIRIAKELKTMVPPESKTESAKRIIAHPNKGEANENTHLVDLGLDPKFKDMIDSVFGQLSDGYWENSPRMRGYWKFARPIIKDNKIYLEIDNAHWNGEVYNLWNGMSDARVKQFLADKIKFLVKEEGLKWDRGNTDTTDYLSYRNPYSVKDCYYAYELLKGRNVGKHPEYSETYIGIKDGKEFPVNVEYIEVDDDWQGNTSPDIYKVSVNGESGETDAIETEKVCVGKVLRDLGYSLKESKKSESDFEGWDGWEDVEGLEDAIYGIEQLAYELRTSVRGSKTRCNTWAELGAHIAQLGADLAEAGENASMKAEAKKKSPGKKFRSTVEDGRKLSH